MSNTTTPVKELLEKDVDVFQDFSNIPHNEYPINYKERDEKSWGGYERMQHFLKEEIPHIQYYRKTDLVKALSQKFSITFKIQNTTWRHPKAMKNF